MGTRQPSHATSIRRAHPFCSLLDPRGTSFNRKQVRNPIMRDEAHTLFFLLHCSYLSQQRAVSRLVSHSTRSNFLFDQSLILTYDSDIKILLLAPVLLLVRHESFSFSVCRVTPLGSGAFGLVITTLAFYLARNMTDGGCVGCGE